MIQPKRFSQLFETGAIGVFLKFTENRVWPHSGQMFIANQCRHRLALRRSAMCYLNRSDISLRSSEVKSVGLRGSINIRSLRDSEANRTHACYVEL